MLELLPFFIVLFAGLFFSELFTRFHLPWVVTLILAGIIIGPFGFGVFTANPTIEFLSQIGLVFLMFMAGLETRISSFRGLKKEISLTAILNGGIPFVLGIGAALLLGLPMQTALLIGIMFISSSVAVILPSLESYRLTETRLGRTIIASTVVEDGASLIILSILLQKLAPTTALPLPVFYILLFLTLLLLRFLITRLRKLVSFLSSRKPQDMFQQELRAIFAILIGTVIVFEVLGLHPIIAGFFAGLVLSEMVTSDILREKLRTLSYGIFIPIFFVVLGSKTDIGVFRDATTALSTTALLLGAIVAGKYGGGYLAGRLAHFTKRESTLIGAATLPQLSTTLAVAFTGLELGILSPALITSMVAVSIVTILASPLIMGVLARHLKRV